MSNYSFFIGCDVSKAVIDISYWKDNSPIYLGQFENSDAGFIQLVDQLKLITDKPSDQWFVCFENTGAYSKLFFNWLYQNSIKCREENPLLISMSLGLRRGKSDKIDSLDICRYAFEKKDSIAPNAPCSEQILKIKKLLSRRDLLVKQQTALKISVSEQKDFIDKDLFDDLVSYNKQLLDVYKAQIKSIDKKIKSTIKSDNNLKITNKLVQSVVGIGPVTAAYLIATTNNFLSFTDPKKYASYCGIAPFPNSSGKRKGRNKVSHMANKKIKALLSNGMLSAISYDPQLAAYYKRKIEQGKKPGVVYNTIKNKIIQRVFAVVKRQSPYVKLNFYT